METFKRLIIMPDKVIVPTYVKDGIIHYVNWDKRDFYPDAYTKKLMLDVGFVEYVYDYMNQFARRNKWAELMKQKKKNFKSLYKDWMTDNFIKLHGLKRASESKFNHDRHISVDGLMLDFLKVFLQERSEDFDKQYYFIIGTIKPWPPEPPPPDPPVCPPDVGPQE